MIKKQTRDFEPARELAKHVQIGCSVRGAQVSFIHSTSRSSYDCFEPCDRACATIDHDVLVLRCNFVHQSIE